MSYKTEQNKYRTRAQEYFKATGQWFEGCVIHHKDESLRHTDWDRYCEWRIEDLEIISRGEHASHHCKGSHFKHKDNSNYQGPKPWMRGKHWKLSDETKANMSLALKKSYEHRDGNAKGKHWFNNGEIERYAFECPDGFVRGRLKRYADQSRK